MAFEKVVFSVIMFLCNGEGHNGPQFSLTDPPENFSLEDHPAGSSLKQSAGTVQLMRRTDNPQDGNAWASSSAYNIDSWGNAGRHKDAVDPMDFVSVDALNTLKLSNMALSSRPGAKASLQSMLGTSSGGEPQNGKPVNPFYGALREDQISNNLQAEAGSPSPSPSENTSTSSNDTSSESSSSNTSSSANATAAVVYKSEDQETYCQKDCHGCQFISDEGAWKCDSAALGHTPAQCDAKQVPEVYGQPAIKLWCDPNLPSQVIESATTAAPNTTNATEEIVFGMEFHAMSTTTTTSWWFAQQIKVSGAGDPMCDGEYAMYDTHNDAPRYLRKDKAMWIVLCGSSMAAPKCMGCEKHHGIFTYVISQYKIGKRTVNDDDAQCELQSHCFAKTDAMINHPYIFMMHEGLIKWFSIPKEEEAPAGGGHGGGHSLNENGFGNTWGHGGNYLGHRESHQKKATRDHGLTIALDESNIKEYNLWGYKVLPFFRFKVGCESEELFERQNDKLMCTPGSEAPYPVKKDFKMDNRPYTVWQAAVTCRNDKQKCVGFDCLYRGPHSHCKIHSCSKDNAPCYGCSAWEDQVTYNSKCVDGNTTKEVPADCASDIQGCLTTLGCTEKVKTCTSDGMEVIDDWQHFAFYKLDLLCKEGTECPYEGMVQALEANPPEKMGAPFFIGAGR